MFVQQFVDTGPFVNHHRVLTLFGAPLLAFKTSSQSPRPALDSPDDVLATIPVKARRRDGPVAQPLASAAE